MIGSPSRWGKRIRVTKIGGEGGERDEREQPEPERRRARGSAPPGDPERGREREPGRRPPRASASPTKPSTLWLEAVTRSIRAGRRCPAGVERAEPVAPEVRVQLRQQLVREVRPVGMQDERPKRRGDVERCAAGSGSILRRRELEVRLERVVPAVARVDPPGPGDQDDQQARRGAGSPRGPSAGRGRRRRAEAGDQQRPPAAGSGSPPRRRRRATSRAGPASRASHRAGRAGSRSRRGTRTAPPGGRGCSSGRRPGRRRRRRRRRARGGEFRAKLARDQAADEDQPAPQATAISCPAVHGSLLQSITASSRPHSAAERERRRRRASARPPRAALIASAPARDQQQPERPRERVRAAARAPPAGSARTSLLGARPRLAWKSGGEAYS